VKSITVHYYGALVEMFGVAQALLHTDARTCADLWQVLVTAQGLTLDHKQLRVAVDDQFAQWDSVLSDGQSVAFMPPFAGG
jgi:molybdopterin converting factor small subunit